MNDHIAGKTVIITGAGSGFGRLTAMKLAEYGANAVCVDIKVEAAQGTAEMILQKGGSALAVAADVTRLDDMHAVVRLAVARFGGVDVLVNNAGVMPLAFVADHQAAYDAWVRCIDINFKGMVNGVVAVHDQMLAQGRGQVVNISSIYGNAGIPGAAVYGATKAAINYFSDALRQESRGKIKVTVVKPTGVPATELFSTVVNRGAGAAILGRNHVAYVEDLQRLRSGGATAELQNPDHIEYGFLDPGHVADAIVGVINQPWGVVISDITVRAAGDYFIT